MYPIQYSDPPWDYDNRVQHGGGKASYTSGAKSFYPTMKPAELQELAPMVKGWTPQDAIHFMWTTGPQLDVAIATLEAWGFKFKTMAFVWDKCRVNPGAYTMSQTEFVIVGTRGAIPKPRGARNVRQLVTEPRTIHSRKPDVVRARIDEMFPDPDHARVEMFAREKVDGWDAWGDGV